MSRCKHPKAEREYIISHTSEHSSELCHVYRYQRWRVKNPNYNPALAHTLRATSWLIWGPWKSPGARVKRALENHD